MFQQQDIVYVPLSRTEVQVLKAVAELETLTGRAHTHDIAASINLSYHQTLRYLKHMEDEGLLQRVGRRGGWKSAA